MQEFRRSEIESGQRIEDRARVHVLEKHGPGARERRKRLVGSATEFSEIRRRENLDGALTTIVEEDGKRRTWVSHAVANQFVGGESFGFWYAERDSD